MLQYIHESKWLAFNTKEIKMTSKTIYIAFSVNTDIKREVFQISDDNIRMVCSNPISIQVVEKDDKEQE